MSCEDGKEGGKRSRESIEERNSVSGRALELQEGEGDDEETKTRFDTHLKILKISSISESPGKRGCLMTISAKIHPTDHISRAVE